MMQEAWLICGVHERAASYACVWVKGGGLLANIRPTELIFFNAKSSSHLLVCTLCTCTMHATVRMTLTSRLFVLDAYPMNATVFAPSPHEFRMYNWQRLAILALEAELPHRERTHMP